MNHKPQTESFADSSKFDEALASIAGSGCELRSGYTSHAPMVIEALRELGKLDRIPGWLDSNRINLLQRPPKTCVIDPESLDQALGVAERFSDWADFFTEQIATLGWQRAAALWTGKLEAGFAAAALHGVIRVGHAVRALTDRDRAERRRELADALASWACAYNRLPVALLVGESDRTLREVITTLPLVPEAHRRNEGSIVDAVGQLPHAVGFSQAVAQAKLDADPHAALTRIAIEFANVFVLEVCSPLTAVVFTHAITGAAAAQHLLRIADAELSTQLVRRSWQAGCALTSAYATGVPGQADSAGQSAVLAPDELVEVAIASGDDHAIKLTEAALWFYAQSQERIFLHAAQRCCETLPGANPN